MKFETEFAGRKLIVTTGELAGQANGACTVQYGETVVLATATMGTEDRDTDFFPLTVEYEEKFYAAGKIKGSRFIKRETKPTDEAILTGRLIDRSLRPLFNQEMRRDVQLINTVLAFDQENSPDMVALCASILALSISDIPWQGPIAGMRIGLGQPECGEQFAINPINANIKNNNLDLIVSGSPDKIVMIEAGAQEVDEETMFKAMKFANDHFQVLLNFFNEIIKKVGKQKNVALLEALNKVKDEYKTLADDFIRDNAQKYLFKQTLKTKADRSAAKDELEKSLDEFLAQRGIDEETRSKAASYIHGLVYREVSRAILEQEKRIDGRKIDEIRPLSATAGFLPRVHGSALFQRGETQVLSIVTLGSPGMEQTLDTMEESGTKRFMHHYNFPPFSVGETGSMRATGRRETGHGALAERGLYPMIPKEDTFAYTIRVVSEVMSSNGSSSMASSCASCLALMDAGVPMKKPVVGVAIGLACEVKNNEIVKYKTFTDLQDLEDGPGGMDFKVIGTRDGITAVQMDTKTPGLNFDIIKEALDRAKNGRNKILDLIVSILPAPRAEVSLYAPKIISFKINPDKIREVVGPGG
ncbi:MAG: polyribonucleotide nucleotidyltransferase, partial [Patescibacteria group bacterium]|nr:polyribonucleotide nucleotidyltransferase [Patescibacteria group bacterium]